MELCCGRGEGTLKKPLVAMFPVQAIRVLRVKSERVGVRSRGRTDRNRAPQRGSARNREN